MKQWLSLIHPDDRERVKRELSKYYISGGTHSVEYRLRARKAGMYLLDEGVAIARAWREDCAGCWVYQRRFKPEENTRLRFLSVAAA